ncbi:pectinesterase inhibitor 4-like [Papaver somniferum]|uniref:pectinesterase inhibitor 4-like n=1 Tax=Papaver somniferum TaxID=3469 RepID=UPI000E6FFAF3|nr:pectinesterase inhibitor 4-like [Papaver somniferum]
MASQNHLLLGFLVIATTVLVLATTSANATADLNELCNDSTYPTLCKSILKVGKGVTGQSDLQAVRSAIQATWVQAKHAMVTLNKTIATTTDPAKKANLETCSELYDTAIDDLATSLSNLKDKVKSDLMINLSAVMTDFDTCTDTFREFNMESPVGNINQLLYQLSTDSLDLAHGLNF